MDQLDRAAILAAQDLPTEQVECDWGTYSVRGLTQRERGILEARAGLAQQDGREAEVEYMARMRAQVVVWGTLNGEGSLFEEGDVDALLEKGGNAPRVLSDVILRLSGLTNPEELEKNSGAGQSAGSSSG